MQNLGKHGGDLDRAIAEYGGTHADWLDLSTGINPVAWPVPPIPAETWHRLPERSLEEYCLDAARAYYGAPDDAAIMPAPGTQSIIQNLPHLLHKGRRVGIVSPTYGEHERCFAAHQRIVGRLTELPRYEDGYDCVIICNPNNPDGRSHSDERSRDMIAALLDRKVMVVVDEAFCDVAPAASLIDMTGTSDGLIVLRSFGKFFGLAGIRLGFAVGAKGLVGKLASMAGPWAVPGPALFIGGRAMRNIGWIAETRTRLIRDRARLIGLLRMVGFEIVGHTDLFVLAAHDRAPGIARELAKARIWVRTFDHDASWLRFGLPGTDADFARLQKALAQAA